ncbi:MAG: chitobiase/beta-hexosaminidase C-terminal domain-containing protein [Lachnospiraceae bacterium]|nr:chitobiase/beta-hexosaminidase C-terminal domain-containing protein [Lachnospiraceae bacterium]
MKRRLRSFQMILGFAVTLIAVLGVTGVFLFTSRAMDELRFVTNNGTVINSQGSVWKVMDGVQAYIDNYAADSETEIYYKFYDMKLSDTEGLLLNTEGTKYEAGQQIILSRALTSGETCYLYVQQFLGEEQRLDEYRISFYDNASPILVSPETSDTEMKLLKAGDILRFIGEGTLFYTVDGSAPSFNRAQKGEDGDITVNGETFIKANASMQTFGTGNTLEIPPSWISQETLTIRVISACDGKEFSSVATFRYILGKDQAQNPTIAPETTAEEPVLVPDGTTASLSTQTDGGTILYTLNGQVPSYEIKQENGIYQLITGENTIVYSDRITVTGQPGAMFTVTAVTIKFSAADGEIMKASEPVQYVYRFAERQIAAAPESSPKSGTAVSLKDGVYLTTETAGAKILYTTDGTSPAYSFDQETKNLVLSGTTKCYGVETGYILIDAQNGAEAGKDFLIQAKTIVIDDNTGEKVFEDSPVVQFSFPVNDLETVAAPTVTPATVENKPTVVEEGDKILLSTTTAGARIYYTTDGSAPVLDENGSPRNETTILYEGQKAITVPKGSGYITITAFAVKEEMNDSAVVQFTYQYPQIIAPPYSKPAEGTVTVNTEVELASLDKDALIYYTLDGSNPTQTTGKLYSEPILLTSSVQIKAICVVNGISSAVRTFHFSVSPVLQPPAPSLASGSVITSGTVIKLSAADGAEILYTVDGSNPKSGSPLSGDTAVLTGKPGETISLITYAKGADYSDSQTATYVYTISNYENGIFVTPASGTKVKEGDLIRIETDVTNAAIYYETNGDIPNVSSPRGNQVLVPASGTEETFLLNAVAVPVGSNFPNAVGSFQYPYLIELAAPKASIPNMAVLLKNQEVELTAEEGDIYYTLDGTSPDTFASLYADKIIVDKPMTIQAFAMNEEGAKSSISTFTYTFADQVGKPVFSVQGGEVETGSRLTMFSDTQGAAIYYTTDGTLPDPENPGNLYTYSGAVSITKPVHIKAIAVKDKMTSSEVVSATFTVKEKETEILKEDSEGKRAASDGNRLMSRRSFMDSDSGPTYTDFVLKHPMTGIILSAKEGLIPVEAQIEVTSVPADETLDKSVQEAAGKEHIAVAAYEVSVKRNGEQVVLSEEVEVGFPIPQQYVNSAIYVASVDEEGNVNLFDTRRDDDMAYVFTDRFGRYCIVGATDVADEEKAFDFGLLGAAATALLLGLGYFLIRKSGKRKG